MYIYVYNYFEVNMTRGRYYKNQNIELRAAVQAAVDDGLITPSEVLDYLLDNGFEPMPTRPTVIAALNECGVIYIAGGWIKTDG